VSRPIRIQGVSASIGVGVGEAQVVTRDWADSAFRKIDDAEVDAELERFVGAVERSREEIERAKRELTELQGATYASILDVYLLMHTDALLIDATLGVIRDERVNADWALSKVIDKLRAPLLADASSYFRERARDIDHVKDHLLRHLSGERRSTPPNAGPTVLIAHDLTPADAVRWLAPPTVGLVTEVGGANSHTAILARTFGVPAVAGAGPTLRTVKVGEVIVVDGFSGEVVVGASGEEQANADTRRQRFVSLLESERRTQAVTRDGVLISVAANIELPGEIQAALDNGAEGVGLYRTEFMCLDRAQPPSEAEQLEAYRAVAAGVAPNNVVFRTFDWRGDKRLRAGGPAERGRAWLKTQVRAILQASSAGSVALMFPMVATLDEMTAAKALVTECVDELGNLGTPVPVGMMVEVPSAALLAKEFVEIADFIAVGTNDLVQYTLGVDRSDAGLASIASPLDPSVLQLLSHTIAAASGAGVPCSMCGDMAADPMGLAMALGLGYRAVSVPPRVVPLARAVVRSIELSKATDAAKEAIGCRTYRDVRSLLVQRLGDELVSPWRKKGIV